MKTKKKVKTENSYHHLSGIVCAVRNCCVTKRSHPHRKLFNFPSRSNKKVFEAWVEKCGVPESRLNRKLKICDVHFRSEDKGKSRLRKTAIPEINLPLCVNGVYETAVDQEENQSVHKPQKIFFCTWPNCCEIFDCMEQFKMHLTIHKDKTLKEIKHEPLQNLEDDVLHPDIKKEFDVPDIVASVPDLDKEIKTELVGEYGEYKIDEFNSSRETFDTVDILEKHTVSHSETKHNNLRSSNNVIDEERTAQQNPRTLNLSESSSSRFKRQKCTCSNCSNNKHNPETPTKHICDFEGCGRVFPKSSNLSRHVQMIHSNVRPYSCDFENCGKSFKLPGILIRHRLTHTVTGLFECFECDFKSSRLVYLARHQKKLMHCGYSQQRPSDNIQSDIDENDKFDHGSDSNDSIDEHCNYSSSSSCSSMSQDCSMQIKTESLDEYGEYQILE